MPAVNVRVMMDQERAAVLPEAKRMKTAVNLEDPVQEKIKFLCDTIKEPEFEIAGGYANREMLLAMLPSVLSTARGVRNGYQQTMANMISDVFGAEEARLKNCLAEAQAKVDADDAELAPFNSAVEQANVAVQAKTEDIQMKEVALARAEGVLNDSKAEVKATDAEESSAANALEAFTTEKENFLEVKQGNYEVMRDGNWDTPKDQKRHLVALKPFFGRIRVEESLVTALSSALGKKPAERGEFDVEVVQQLEDRVASGLSSLEEKVAAASAEASERKDLSIASTAVLEVAKEKKQVAVEAVETAKEELVTLEIALADAQKVLKDRKKLGMAFRRDRSSAKTNLFFFQSEVGSRLTWLLEWSPESQVDAAVLDEKRE